MEFVASAAPARPPGRPAYLLRKTRDWKSCAPPRLLPLGWSHAEGQEPSSAAAEAHMSRAGLGNEQIDSQLKYLVARCRIELPCLTNITFM